VGGERGWVFKGKWLTTTITRLVGISFKYFAALIGIKGHLRKNSILLVNADKFKNHKTLEDT
jgi:hypothetical protein